MAKRTKAPEALPPACIVREAPDGIVEYLGATFEDGMLIETHWTQDPGAALLLARIDECAMLPLYVASRRMPPGDGSPQDEDADLRQARAAVQQARNLMFAAIPLLSAAAPTTMYTVGRACGLTDLACELLSADLGHAPLSGMPWTGREVEALKDARIGLATHGMSTAKIDAVLDPMGPEEIAAVRAARGNPRWRPARGGRPARNPARG